MNRLSPYLLGIFMSILFFACQKERSFEMGGTGKAYLQNASGECSPKVVGGTYTASTATTAANYVDVGIYVKDRGSYNIVSDTVNGYYFKGTGNYADTGLVTVRLKAIGTPIVGGSDIFTFILDTTICNVTVPVGGSATGGNGSCNASVNGSYFTGTALNTTHTVTLQHTYATAGTYIAYTDTINGYSFRDTITAAAATAQNITLEGTGIPVAPGNNNFTVHFGDAATCSFGVTAITATPAGSCPTFTPSGTYTAGAALTATNKVSLNYTYAAAGTYSVTTNTVNGYSFSKSVTAAAGTPIAFDLPGVGTPTASGTNTFTVNFGDGNNSCTFIVTVNGSTPPTTNTSYFPMTTNSYWTYDFPASSGDTLKIAVGNAVTLNGKSYTQFIYSDDTGNLDTVNYRKDAATGFFYEYNDLSIQWGAALTFSQPKVDINFLRENLTSGTSWNNDFVGTTNGINYTARYKFTCINAAATVTLNGKTFNNVYEIKMELQLGANNIFQTFGQLNYYYAKGIGQINIKEFDSTSPTQVTDEYPIRYWKVF